VTHATHRFTTKIRKEIAEAIYSSSVVVGRRHTVQPPSEWDRQMDGSVPVILGLGETVVEL